MQNRKTKTNTNPSPDPNRYRRRCPDPNARIQKFIHYMAIATFAIADCHRAEQQDTEIEVFLSLLPDFELTTDDRSRRFSGRLKAELFRRVYGTALVPL